jgi:hypothetical protein
MATKQKDIAVSEFFAKNRHLLGFDNPRKALLTTVKEAVDNSLDACEEAGICPMSRSSSRICSPIGRPRQAIALSRYRHRQRAGHRAQAGGKCLRPAALRQQISSPENEPRPAGHRHQRRRHVRPDHHRQADGHSHPPHAKKPAHHIELAMNTKTNRAEVTVDDETEDFPPQRFKTINAGTRDPGFLSTRRFHHRHQRQHRAGRPISERPRQRR